MMNKEIIVGLTNEELLIELQGKEGYERDLIVEQLFDNNEKLCHYVAKKFKYNDIEYDDLVTICRVGMMRAINQYNSEQQFKFSTYCFYAMRNEVVRYLKSQNKLKEADWSLDFEMESGDLHEVVEIPNYDVEKKVVLGIMVQEMHEYARANYKGTKLKVFEFIANPDRGMVKDFLDELGMSKTAVNNHMRNIRRELKEFMYGDLNTEEVK